MYICIIHLKQHIDGSVVGAPDPIPNLATSFQTYTTLDVAGS